jgi:hypothetical protein
MTMSEVFTWAHFAVFTVTVVLVLGWQGCRVDNRRRRVRWGVAGLAAGLMAMIFAALVVICQSKLSLDLAVCEQTFDDVLAVKPACSVGV